MPSRFVHDELRRADLGRSTAYTIGVFDGVHLGHQYLVRQLISTARSHGMAAGVVTFHPHPRAIVRPDFQISYLTSLEERVELLTDLGVDTVAALPFTSELAQLSAREFCHLLHEDASLRLLVIGPDFALGRGREGIPERLREIGGEFGFQVEVVPPLELQGVKVSSTRIRQALTERDVRTAAALLGRPFSLRGPVVRGERRGRLLGFPTANIAVGRDHALPGYGVYVTRAYVGEHAWPSVTNIGVRPTFDASQPTIETHLFDFDGDLYEREVKIDLLEAVRAERRFAGLDELREQIRHDAAFARAWFETHEEHHG